MATPRSKVANMKPGSPDSGPMGAIGRFWQRSYAADYISFVLLILAYTLIDLFVEPFHRMFSLDDLSIQYPHAAVERVSVFWNIAYAVCLPLCLMLLWAVIAQPGTHKVHVTVLGFAVSCILAATLTELAKNAIGRPRPDLISRCKPKKGIPLHELVTIDICTETNHHLLHDGWKSFPSGHSTLAFSGLGFFAFFLAGQLHVLRPRTNLARVLIALAPLVGAAMIAISRLEDYRHDVFDVTVGSLIGIIVAVVSYRIYYPGLKSAHCDQPYPSRADTASKLGAGKRTDEEALLEGRRVRGDNENGERVPLRDTSRESD